MRNDARRFPAIVLCGGKSSRMGTPKGLLRFTGRFWLDEQMRRFHDVGGTHAVVVLGYDRERYARALPWIERAREDWLERDGLRRLVVVNETPERGPFSSLIRAARIVTRERFPGAFVLPIDVPAPRQEVWAGLESAMSQTVRACVPTCGGSGGHPVLLSESFVAVISAQSADSPDARLDHQIRKLLPSQVARVEVGDPQIRMNLNRPADAQAVLLHL